MVFLEDGSQHDGVVIGSDEDIDLAVIGITADDPLPYLRLGDSSGAMPGEDVIALGFPLGDILGETLSVTRGVVSSRRTIQGVDYIQNDAAVNPGSSGGPLLNSRGQAIGINTSRVEIVLGRSIQGIGLAIASSSIKEYLASLEGSGLEVVR
jgi:serine protease Do